MPICDALTGGIARTCDNNAGGVTNIYIADFSNVSSYTEANGILTAITMASTTQFFEFEFNRNTSSYNEEMTISLDNGSTFYSQSVNLILSRREAAKREALKELTAGQKELFVIVKDSNGLYWAFGLQEGMITTAMTSGSGVAKGDANNYNITFTAEEVVPAPEVDETIIAALLSPAV